MIFVSREIDVLSEHYPLHSGRLCSHPDEYRITCGALVSIVSIQQINLLNVLLFFRKYPDHLFNQNITESLCTHQHCCYSSISGCYHSMPSRYQYFTTFQNASLRCLESSIARPPFSNDLASTLQFILQEKTSNRIRMQVGESINELNYRNETSIFTYKINEKEFSLDVYKTSSGKLLLTTKYGALLASKGYFEWSFLVKNATELYGLGQFPIKSYPFKDLLLHNGNPENSFIPFILARGSEQSIFYSRVNLIFLVNFRQK